MVRILVTNAESDKLFEAPQVNNNNHSHDSQGIKRIFLDPDC